MPDQTSPPPPPSTTHSPGPWSLKETEAHPYEMHLCDAYGQYIADITSPIPVLPDKGFDALSQRNLELMRLGPELLAALQDMVALVCECLEQAIFDDEGEDAERRLQIANSLIAKAHGQ